MSDKIIIPGSRANLTAELRERVIENGKLRRALAETTETIKGYAALDAQVLETIREGESKLAWCVGMLEDTRDFVDRVDPFSTKDADTWADMKLQISNTLKKGCGP